MIVAAPGSSALAAKAATSEIPIVFSVGGDPVQMGLVASLNRPGGTTTGVTSLNVELGPKRVELMRELLPSQTVMALLVNPTNPNARVMEETTLSATRALGLKLYVVRASNERELASIYDEVKRLRTGMVIGTDPFFIGRGSQIGELAARHAIPTIFQNREFVTAGGLASYSDSIGGRYRQIGVYVGRILKGEKPEGLPVQQPIKFELIINLQAAKALGLTVPTALLVRADEVIE